MPGDLTRAHAARVHRHDLVVEAREPPLVFGDQLRVEAARAVARHLNVDLAGPGDNRFTAIAVPAVAGLIAIAKMMIHLRIQRAFGERLLQRIQQAA